MAVLALACTLVGIGLYGALSRRELVAVLASIEVMLGGGQLLLAAYAAGTASPSVGEAVNLIVLAVAAGEAALGLAIVITLVRSGRHRTDQIEEVRG